MKITRQELLAKAEQAGVGYIREMDLEKVIVRTACALGYEVVEEPAFPERLRVGTSGAFIDAVTGDVPVDEDWYRLRPELARRYNAKAAVMAVARAIEAQLTPRDSGTSRAAWARRLRAAYEEAP